MCVFQLLAKKDLLRVTVCNGDSADTVEPAATLVSILDKYTSINTMTNSRHKLTRKTHLNSYACYMLMNSDLTPGSY
jgi:hypothetical protein